MYSEDAYEWGAKRKETPMDKKVKEIRDIINRLAKQVKERHGILLDVIDSERLLSHISTLGKKLEEAEKNEMPEFKDYDSGYLNDYGGGNINWWWDYIRSEVSRANKNGEDQYNDLLSHIPSLEKKLEDQIELSKFQIGVNVQRCKEHGFYFANSPEYPCPWCNSGKLEQKLEEAENKVIALTEINAMRHYILVAREDKMKSLTEENQKLREEVKHWQNEAEHYKSLYEPLP